MKVLAICTGNTCRSPMVMGLTKKLYPDFEVDSAGIFACGEEISKNSVLALLEEGIDLSGYISKSLTLDALESADVILCATNSHKEAIENFVANKKVIVLDCPDPYGADLKTYIKTKDYLLQKLKEISFD